MLTDPISDMLTQIRNASAVKKAEVVLPYSNLKFSIGKIMEKEGYVGKVTKVDTEKFPMLSVSLKYNDGQIPFTCIKRISKPGRRVYAKKDELPHVRSGMRC